jgi:formylglycine-generating enzyme required for sulfatase activity
MRSLSAYFILIFCTLSSSLFCQTEISKYSLPGFVQLNDTLFISKFEVDIREYARFLIVWRKHSGDAELLRKAWPNPNYLGWTYWNSFNNSLIIYSTQYEVVDSSYATNTNEDTLISYTAWISNLPVVNVTKEQASLYCDFRTKDYQIFYRAQNNRKKKKYPASLVFRLPTSAEWLYAASAGLNTDIYKYGDKEKHGKSFPVCAETFQNDTTGQLHPFPVSFGQVNGFGLVNMCGNVAELVEDQSNVYGGSFKQPLRDCSVVSKELFSEAKNNIGFRIVAVIRKN